MSKLVIAADIHGYYSVWKYIKSLLSEHDVLAIAGDFFDTRYGHSQSDDYRPEAILNEFSKLPNKKHYVYGNCDHESFCPGYGYIETFTFNGLNILLTHGNFSIDEPYDFDLKITGHTHRKELIKKKDKIYLNPGSIALPKEGPPSYAVIENKKILLIGVEKGIVGGYDIVEGCFL